MPDQAESQMLQEAYEALVESQDRFRQMAENIRDVVWLTDLTMTSVIYVNPAYEEMWGRPVQSLYEQPRSWFEAVHPEDQPRVRQLFERPLTEQGYESAYRVRRPNGSVRWVLDRRFPVEDNRARFYRLVGIARDITEQKELEQEILDASEREQRRIGQDLHDDLCQQLVGIEFLSKALEQKLKGQSQAGQAREIAELVRAAIEHTRVLARGLAPFELETDGLRKGLQTLATRTSELFRIRCSFHCPAPVNVADAATGINLYRIAQEAVTNSIKHGKAGHVQITLATTEREIQLVIRDDGAGFFKEGSGRTGMGMRIMQYRAELIGGTFSVQPETQGVRVTCLVPIAANDQTKSDKP